MATTFPGHKVARKAASRGFDIAVAGFAAGAAAFVCFAMPGDLADALVQASALPALVPAAAPPIGNTARLLLAILAAAGTFGLLFLLLRALSRPAPRRAIIAAPEPVEPAAPRLRRADAHPDAPPRRPILAGLDLGDPILSDEPVAEPVNAAEVPFEPVMPDFLERVPTDDAPPSEDDDITGEAEHAAPDDRVPTSPAVSEQSLADLVRRLEQGLAGQARTREPAPLQSYEPVSIMPTPVRPDPLADVMADLERLAARR